MELIKPEPPRTASLFDMQKPAAMPHATAMKRSIEAEILTEVNEKSDEEEETWDEAA